MDKEKIIEIVKQEFENFNESIKETLQQKGINATKEAFNSLRVETNENNVKSLGVFYLEFLDTGRAGGKKPPYEKILQWLVVKTGLDESELKGLAFYVQNKIANEGTEIFKNNSKGIELTKKKEIVRENLSISLKKEIKEQLIQRLDKFKKLYESKQKK